MQVITIIMTTMIHITNPQRRMVEKCIWKKREYYNIISHIHVVDQTNSQE